MNNSCQRFKSMVSNYIEGELDQKNQGLMEKHLRACLGCKRKISQLKQLIQNLKKLPKISVTPDFETILRARINRENRLAKRQRNRWLPTGQFRLPAYVFGAAVLALALFTVFAINKSNRISPPQANMNEQWIQPQAVEKVDPTTKERYLYIIEKQEIPNVNYQVPSESENDGTIDENIEADSSYSNIEDVELRQKAMFVSGSNIY